jgi:hypothetical protein
MLRNFSHAMAVAAAFSLPVSAIAADGHAKRQIHHWHGYGFLPGYEPPPDPRQVHYGPQYYFDGGPQYYNGAGWYYFGRPGFNGGRWNGGSYGPCWTHTPIGLMWNCG